MRNSLGSWQCCCVLCMMQSQVIGWMPHSSVPCYTGQPALTGSWQMAKWVTFSGLVFFFFAAAAHFAVSLVSEGRPYFHSGLACWVTYLYTYSMWDPGERASTHYWMLSGEWEAGQRSARVKTDWPQGVGGLVWDHYTMSPPAEILHLPFAQETLASTGVLAWHWSSHHTCSAGPNQVWQSSQKLLGRPSHPVNVGQVRMASVGPYFKGTL